mmetsp:Transcript_3187/g.7493  ORF Transcript_3187/g.7493 Transcript_3187/m.7493 type:complete len:163 (+) Transcript_3187:120-608(+)
MRTGALSLFFPAVVRSELVFREHAASDDHAASHDHQSGAGAEKKPPCHGYADREDEMCGKDERHWVCAKLVEREAGGRCEAVTWNVGGEAQDFWTITGQQSWKDRICNSKSGGDHWCICKGKYEELLQKTGEQCGSVKVDVAASRIGSESEMSELARGCLGH